MSEIPQPTVAEKVTMSEAEYLGNKKGRIDDLLERALWTIRTLQQEVMSSRQDWAANLKPSTKMAVHLLRAAAAEGSKRRVL